MIAPIAGLLGALIGHSASTIGKPPGTPVTGNHLGSRQLRRNIPTDYTLSHRL